MDEDLPRLNGDPSTADSVCKHDGSDYCMDITSTSAGTAAAANFVRWYDYLPRQTIADQTYFKKIHSAQKKPDKRYTHGAMNGMKGYFYVDNDEEFLEIYARLWSKTQGEFYRGSLYLVEKPTEIFRLFMDFDFKQRMGVTPQGIEALARVVHRVVAKFWVHAQSVIVCCSNYTTTDTTDAEGTKVPLIKTGVHLHWPDVYCTTETLLHVRESILSELQDTFGGRSFPMNAWSDVFDVAPYNHGSKQGSGLRLLGSKKATPCVCKRQKEKPDFCDKCQNRGYLDADGHGRPYLLWAVFTDDMRDIEQERSFLKNFHDLVKATSIRAHEAASPCTIPMGAPLYFEQTETRKRKVTHRAKEVVHGDPSFEACELAIRSHPHYGHIVVNHVAKKADAFLVHVTGMNSRFCQNMGREHRSNRIWFKITPDGVRQRCHDDGESTEMKYMLCKEYESAPWPLPGASIKVLFPNDDETCTTLVSKLTSHKETADVVKTLVAYGDKLCKDLYGTSWSATLLFKDATLVKQYISGLQEYTVHYPEHLGKKHPEALLTLGYAQEMVTTLDDVEEGIIPGIKSLLELEQELFSAFTDIVDYVAFSDTVNEQALYMFELIPSSKRMRRGDID